MKFLTYAAVIALFSATAAFAQTGPSGDAANPAMQNNPPAASDQMSDHGMSGQNMGNMNMSGQGMSSTSGTAQTTHHTSTRTSHRSIHHAVRSDTAAENARENRETEQLNRSQLRASASSTSSMMPQQGMYQGSQQGYTTTSNPTGNPFDNGSPQAAQAGGPNCTPDNPSCGTARENPAINSSPQHRLYPESPAATSPQ